MIDKSVICIGGSAGSIPIIMRILASLPASFDYTIIIVLHRLKNVKSEMATLLIAGRKDLKISEPEDKEPVQKNHIYLAPQNYHLLVEDDKIFSLDYSEPVNNSRPSIDVSFQSVASVYKSEGLCILLSGANDDGAAGASAVLHHGGKVIVQDPQTAEYPQMPQSAIDINKNVSIRTVTEIVNDFEHSNFN